jgi:hypothetical protein
MLDYQYLPVAAEGTGEKHPPGVRRNDDRLASASDRHAARWTRRFRLLTEVGDQPSRHGQGPNAARACVRADRDVDLRRRRGLRRAGRP